MGNLKINKKFLILAFGVIGIVVFLYWYFNFCNVCLNLGNINAERVRDFIAGFGSLSMVVYVLLYTLNTFSPFFPPILFMSLAAGLLFGPVWGTVALTLGTFCGTTAAFLTARYLGRSWVEKFVKNKSGAQLYDKLSQNGFFILLPLRLIGFPPYGLIDFICGLSKMKYLDFVAATMLASVPWIIVQVLLADRIANFDPKDPVLWGILITFVLMIVVTSKIVKKKQAGIEKGNLDV